MVVRLQFCVSTDPFKRQLYTETSMMSGFLIEDVVIRSFAPQKEVQGPLYDAIKTFCISLNEQGFIENLRSWPNASLNIFMTYIFEFQRIIALGNIWKPETLGWFILKN